MRHREALHPPRLLAVFNIQGSELVFLLLIALIVLGPEKLPDAIRKFTKTYAEFKKVAGGFQGELRQVLDEPMRELRGTADAIREAAMFDPEAAAEATPAAADERPKPMISEIVTRPAAEQREAGLNFGTPGARRAQPPERRDPAAADAAPAEAGTEVAESTESTESTDEGDAE